MANPIVTRSYAVSVIKNGCHTAGTIRAPSLETATTAAKRIFNGADSLAVTDAPSSELERIHADRCAELREAYANRRTVDTLQTKVRARIRRRRHTRIAGAAIVGGLLALAVALAVQS